jgi:hypothetical protein
MAVATLNATASNLTLPEALIGALGGYKALTLSGALTLTDAYPSMLGLDPGGSARDVTLDAAAGQYRVIVNKADAAETITVKNAAAATIVSLVQNSTVILFGDKDDGWKLVAKFTTSLT